jgi:hypothetical protein
MEKQALSRGDEADLLPAPSWEIDPAASDLAA